MIKFGNESSEIYFTGLFNQVYDICSTHMLIVGQSKNVFLHEFTSGIEIPLYYNKTAVINYS